MIFSFINLINVSSEGMIKKINEQMLIFKVSQHVYELKNQRAGTKLYLWDYVV